LALVGGPNLTVTASAGPVPALPVVSFGWMDGRITKRDSRYGDGWWRYDMVSLCPLLLYKCMIREGI